MARVVMVVRRGDSGDAPAIEDHRAAFRYPLAATVTGKRVAWRPPLRTVFPRARVIHKKYVIGFEREDASDSGHISRPGRRPPGAGRAAAEVVRI